MLRNSKTKILILVDWFEPGYKAGGPIQSCKNFVRAFQHEYDLFIITSDRDIGDTMPYENIRTNHWLDYEEHVRAFYATDDRLSFNGLRTLITDIAPDYIHLNNMFSLRFTIIPLLLQFTGRVKARMVLSPRGMLQKGAMHFKTFKKKLFLSCFKVLNIPQRIIFHATDEQERKDVLKYFPLAAQVLVAPNFGNSMDTLWVPTRKVPGELKLIFLSRISPKKNLAYVLQLLKDFTFNAQIYLDIAGGIEDKAYWDDCKEIMAGLPPNIRVNYIGSIKNDEILPLYASYHCFILPTLGENFGHAIFEAFLAGKPVLISDKTPWKKLAEKQIGYEIALDQPAVFKAAIQQFADWDQNEYDLWSKAAWSYAQYYRAQSDTKAKYKEIFK